MDMPVTNCKIALVHNDLNIRNVQLLANSAETIFNHSTLCMATGRFHKCDVYVLHELPANM